MRRTVFTGIVQSCGEIQSLVDIKGDKRVLIAAADLDLANVHIGDSIAVNGVCLTVTEFAGEHGFWMDVSIETIQCTTFGELMEGSKVNLELSLTPHSALGGHLVSGHVDGVGKVLAIDSEARSTRFTFEAPRELGCYIAGKGSITIDGTSLTVNGVNSAKEETVVFDVNIIPHTQQNTLFHSYEVGARVNLEVDIIARYVERMTSFTRN